MDLPTTPEPAKLESPRHRVITVPFAMAVVMLALAACFCGPLAFWMDLNPRKLGIDLRVPLASLDEGVLAPYRVIQRNVLDPITVEALGTEMYLSWQLEDDSRPKNDPLRSASLFVTYDTGGATLVPHTPDKCWIGGGYEPAQAHENVDLELGVGAGDRLTVPVRVCTFVKTSLRNRAKQTVVYTFNCNGEFVASRTGVRILVNKPTNRYAYFSKVEIAFPGASRADSVRGAAMLFERLMPALVASHWPDFGAAEQAARDRR